MIIEGKVILVVLLVVLLMVLLVVLLMVLGTFVFLKMIEIYSKSLPILPQMIN